MATDKLAELREKREDAALMVSEAEATAVQLANKHAEVAAPFQKRMEALRNEMASVLADIERDMKTADNDKTVAHRILDEATLKCDIAKWETAGPGSWEEFHKWAQEVGEVVTDHKKFDTCGFEELRAPKVEGFDIYAAKSWNGRVYAAWRKGKFVGWLRVKPSEHPGDTNDAWGAVKGKQFLKIIKGEWVKEGKYDARVETSILKPDDWYNGVPEPVKQFTEALKAFSQ